MCSARPDFLSYDIWKDGIFDNKVVFCTGGSGTICSAQVRAMVYLGANACIVGRNVEKTNKMAEDIAMTRPDSRVIGIAPVDVRNFKSIQDAVEQCAKQLGGIDYVIAGAAGNFLASINNLSANAFKSVIDIDVLGSFNTFKATSVLLAESAAKYGKERQLGTGGRIVFISATMHYTGVPFQTHVVTAKAGIDALSNNIALEFGPMGMTSNVIAPGPIQGTEGVERLFPSEDRTTSLRSQPLGKYGCLADISDATIYLFSHTGSHVTGSTLVVDGASWRIPAASAAGTLAYPSALLSGSPIVGVAGSRI